MGKFTRIVAWAGFGAALFLCLFDGYTSYLGVRLLLSVKDGVVTRDNRPIAVFMPINFAVLALCFNGLSAYMFRKYREESFTQFAPTVTFIMWMIFVAYDFVSSFIGMLETYSPVRITSLETVIQGMEELGTAAAFLVIIMALLLSFGPFLCCQFYELANSKAE